MNGGDSMHMTIMVMSTGRPGKRKRVPLGLWPLRSRKPKQGSWMFHWARIAAAVRPTFQPA